ncbi:MAG TPA: hypothetical protein PK874_08905 [Desulfobacteraceae bacterium]|nr:hypothetical protein [Desulfobacteraceae bacterium]HPJ67812.1 hypothetical protein [Desulfobacteraceae bacterium]HPQ28030.1 hypothetical protein [Desulfobacteraceae bacterium]
MRSINENPNLIAEFSLIELTEILVKNQGLHEGLYNLTVQFQIAVGTVGPSPESMCPGAMMGVSRIGLSKTAEGKENVHTVNAALVNPPPKKKQTTTKK